MGKTIIISSHILSELQTLCNRCAIIERGRLIYSGPVQGASRNVTGGRIFHVRVSTDPASAATLLKSAPGIHDTEVAEGRVRVVLDTADADPSVIAKTLVDAGHRLTELREEEIGLEEVFLRVTKGETQ